MPSDRIDMVKNAGFILKPDSPEIKSVFKRVRQKFISRNIGVMTAEHSAEMIGIEGVSFYPPI